MISFKKLDAPLANRIWEKKFAPHHYDFGTAREKLANNSRRYLAVEDETPIGFVAIRVHYGKQTGSRQCWYSHKIAVLPEHQSRWADVSDAIAEVVDASGKEYRCITPVAYAQYRENNPRWKKVNDNTERGLSSWLWIGTNPDPTPEPTKAPTPIDYVPAFLTQEEHDALFQACDKIPFSITKTRWGLDVLHSSMTYGPEGYEMRQGYNGDFALLKDAPDAIKMLQRKLSEYAGKQIDYLCVVRYRDGNDGMTWHQHSEDRHGQDASVWIVRTGTDRTLSIAPIIGYKKNKKGEVPIRGDITHILMAKGSLAVLPSSFNDTHQHAVLKYKDAGLCYSINCKVLPTLKPNKPKPRVYDCHAGKKYPADAIYVGCRVERGGEVIREGTIFGNGTNPLESHRGALDVDAFREYAKAKMADPEFRKQVESLRGKDLLCWCKQDIEGDKCHANVWLELANAVTPASEPEQGPDPTPVEDAS